MFSNISHTRLLLGSLFLVAALIACGGGGGSSTLTPLTYTGNTSPAVITLENATQLVANVLYAGDSGSNLPTGVDARDTGTSPAAATPGLDYLDALIRSIKANAVYHAASRTDIAYRIDIDEPLFCESGSASMTGTLDENTGLGTLTLTYNDCTVEGFTFDGQASLTFLEFDFGYSLPVNSRIDITLLTVKGMGFSGSMSGQIGLQLEPQNNRDVTLLNYVAKDNLSGKMFRYENLVITTVYDNYFTPTTMSQSLTGEPGRTYDSTWGYVVIDTSVAMVYSSILKIYPDLDGVVTFTGASGASIRLTVLSEDSLLFELDLDDVAGYEQSRILSWNDLAIDANTDLSSIDESNVLRVPFVDQTLTGFTSDAYVGQTFSLPEAASLQQLTVYLTCTTGIDFHLLLVETGIDPVTGLHPTTVLYESATVSVPAAFASTPISIDLSATQINPNQTYALILDGYVAYTGISRDCQAAVNWPNPYPLGSYIHSGTYPAHTTTREENFDDFWYEDDQYDMSFILEYTTD